MQYTNHYNLNLPEGTDIVNPLVQDNPNYTAIDGALYANKVRVIGNATEIKSGTVHAITRSDSDIDVIRFTATGDWITDDTMTVDGTPVSVYLQDGTAPLTGAYVINTEVVAVINGSRVTLYGAQTLPGYTASDITYDNTGSGLTAVDVQDAIDEIDTEVDAVKSNQQSITRYSVSGLRLNSCGKVAQLSLAGATIATGDDLSTLSPWFKPKSSVYAVVADATSNKAYILRLDTYGKVTIQNWQGVAYNTQCVVTGSLTYIVD